MGPADPLVTLTARVEELSAQLASLEERVARIEPARAPEPSPVEIAAPRPVRLDVTLVGRSLIVLGGGYLLRAVTDLRVVPQVVGVGAGLLLAAALVALADRAARRGRSASSDFHGATALLIAYPLVGEMVVRLGLIGPWTGALLIAAFGAAMLVVAERRRDVGLAWVAALATLAAAPVLAAKTGSLLPGAALLTALLAATGWLAPRLGQRFLVWPVAVVGDAVLLLGALLVLLGRGAEPAWGAVAVASVFFAVSVGGPLARALRGGVTISIAEMVQGGAAFLCAFAGAARVAAGLDGGAGFAALSLIAGAGLGVVALRGLAGRGLGYFTSLGLAVVLVALAGLLGGTALALADLVPAAALLVVARRRAHPLGEAQATVALAAAALASGLLTDAARGLSGDPAGLAAPGAGALVVLAALAAAAVAGVREPPAGARPVKLVALALAALGAGGVAAWAGIALAHAGPAAAATIRTAVLSAGAVALALASRSARVRSAALLVYPVLVLAAARIALEDLRVGVPATLFASLALFGVALIAAPRLRRKD